MLRWLAGVSGEPQLDAVMVELLGPHQSGQGLALYLPLVLGKIGVLDGGVEFVGFGPALFKEGIEISEGLVVLDV